MNIYATKPRRQELHMYTYDQQRRNAKSDFSIRPYLDKPAQLLLSIGGAG